MKSSAFVVPLLLALPLAAGITGCGSIESDRCDAICDCENCGDRERQECDIIQSAEVEVASTYDCYELLEPYWECQLDSYECDNGHYRDDNGECGDFLREYEECLDAKSTRRPGHY
ncbi:MAG: hypothetical protein U0271_32425 [Polyangiaceae bacterium]